MFFNQVECRPQKQQTFLSQAWNPRMTHSCFSPGLSLPLKSSLSSDRCPNKRDMKELSLFCPVRKERCCPTLVYSSPLSGDQQHQQHQQYILPRNISISREFIAFKHFVCGYRTQTSFLFYDSLPFDFDHALNRNYASHIIPPTPHFLSWSA